MGKSWPKLIRDPVHDIITFEDKPWDRLLLDLINTAEFQRLRRIKQLGMSEMVFPGANHSRFAHSIGVMHNARRFLNRIEHLTGNPTEEVDRTAVLVAALLHDLGHGPFSHTFEKITGENHETRTTEVILSSDTDVNRVLHNHDKALPDILRRFFDEDIDGENSSVVPQHLVQVVSSQLDADRFDYLLRDAGASGADYGQFDSRWIIEHLVLNEKKQRLHLSNKAYIAAETYVFARYHMYRAVYFHKTTRAAEVMLRLLFQRFKARLGVDKQPVPEAPPALVRAFTSGGKMDLADYICLDDHTVTEFAKACRKSTDNVLARLAAGLLDRKLFKVIDVTDAEPVALNEFVHEVKEQLQLHELGPDSAFVADTAADTPYKPYDPDEAKPATQIYVEDSMGVPREFGILSKAVRELQSRYALIRYYFPAESRDAIEQIADRHLRKVSRP